MLRSCKTDIRGQTSPVKNTVLNRSCSLFSIILLYFLTR